MVSVRPYELAVRICFCTPWTWYFHCKTNRTRINLSATSISSPFLFVLFYLSLSLSVPFVKYYICTVPPFMIHKPAR